MRLAPLLVLVACIRLPADDFLGDFDDDGFVVGTDCDDFDPDVFPGATEYCDGEDDDCDGTPDDDADGATPYYPDADGDGWGDPAGMVVLCEAEDGWTELTGDCDDSDATRHPSADEADCEDPVDRDCDGRPAGADADGDGSPSCVDCDDADAGAFPGAEERCNADDDDCDGLVDEEVATLTWHHDDDGDGFGDPADSYARCAPVSDDDTLDGTDCDDGAADVHPGAAETCDGEDDDCDDLVDEDDDAGSTRWYVDLDGDGWGGDDDWIATCETVQGRLTTGGDCDDTDPSVSPSAAETCAGPGDEDCDGVVDEAGAVDASTWYRDADADGWGRDGSATTACAQPRGYVPEAGDCDDARDETSPGADEYCDSVDTDCDGEAADAESLDAPAWYPDSDGDGYGDASRPEYACDAPSERIADGTDCNDFDPAIHPDADEADCDDPVDYNCDGSGGETDADGDGWPACEDCDDADAAIRVDADETCATSYDDDCDGDANDTDAVGCTDWYVDADGDGWPGGAPVCACDAFDDHVHDTAGDCDDETAATNPDATDTSNGVDDDCDGRVDEVPYATDDADGVVTGIDADDEAGGALAVVPDADGAGDDAVLIGAAEDDTSATDAGAAYRVGGIDWSTGTLTSAGAALVGPDASDRCGHAVAATASLLLVGCPGDDLGGADAGAVYVTSTSADGDVTTEADAVLWSGDPGAAAGSAVAVGDADGDGVADVLAGGPDGGAAWLWTGPLAGSLDDGSAALVVSEASSDAGAATALCDLDGDGLADVIVGVPGYDYRSTDNGIAGWVYAPGPGGTLAIGDLDGWVYGTYRGSLGGTALACAGDVDGDGLDDVLAGAPGATGGASGSGVAYLVAAPPTGASTMAATTYWQGGVRYDEAGAEVAAAGDVDGDGRQDVWVGAPGYDGEAGAAWLFLGSATGALVEDDARTVVRGDVAGGRLGEALAAGDLDGDGADDALVGAPGDTSGGVDAGAVWLFDSEAL